MYCITTLDFCPLRHDPASPRSHEQGAPSSLQSEIETQPLDDSSQEMFHNLSIVRDSQEELANEVCIACPCGHSYNFLYRTLPRLRPPKLHATKQLQVGWLKLPLIKNYIYSEPCQRLIFNFTMTAINYRYLTLPRLRPR